MLKTIKIKKRLTLLGLLQKFEAGEVPRGKYKTGYGNWVSFDVNRKINFSQNDFINHRLSDVYEVEVKEEVTEDTKFAVLVEIFDENTIDIHYCERIKDVKDSRTEKIYALIDGELKLVWERDSDE